MRHLAAILTVLLAAPAAADPAGWEHSVSGLLDLRVTDERRNTTPLAARPAEAEATAIASTYAAGFEAWKGGLALASQLRAHTNSAGDNRARLRVDELYAEYAVTPEYFLYAGRRNIVYGASFGVNPLDVFLDPRARPRQEQHAAAAGNPRPGHARI